MSSEKRGTRRKEEEGGGRRRKEEEGGGEIQRMRKKTIEKILIKKKIKTNHSPAPPANASLLIYGWPVCTFTSDFS